MNFLKNKAMPKPPDDSIYALIEIFIICGTFIIVCWKWVDSYFKSKKDNNQDFIESVVKATMNASLAEFKSEFHEFRLNTEKQIARFNDTVTGIYKDMAKK